MSINHQASGNDDLEARLSEDYPQSWIPEAEGDTIVGEVVRYTTGTTQYGESPVVVLRTADGLRSVWLLSTVLRSQFGKLKPRPGERVGIRYGSERTSASGNAYRDFRVEVDRGDALPDFGAWADEVPEDEPA